MFLVIIATLKDRVTRTTVPMTSILLQLMVTLPMKDRLTPSAPTGKCPKQSRDEQFALKLLTSTLTFRRRRWDRADSILLIPASSRSLATLSPRRSVGSLVLVKTLKTRR